MNVYDVFHAQLNHFVLPGQRVLVKRWFVDFLVANPRLPAFAAAQAASQLLSRWGADVLTESLGETWTTRPLPATRSEWQADGYRVPDDAQPLMLSHLDGSRTEMFLLFDVELVDEQLVGTIDHLSPREPAAPFGLSPSLSEFSFHLGERERVALSNLWRICTVLEWSADVDPVREGQIEKAGRHLRCRPCSQLRSEDACYRLLIHPDVGRSRAMPLILGLMARLLGSWIQGRREGIPRRSNPVEQVSDAEVAVVSHIVGRRLGLGEPHVRGAPDVPEDIDWGRVVETTQVMEDLLEGKQNPLLPVGTTDGQTPVTPRLLVKDPYREVARELNEIRDEGERQVAERWLLDFVAGNGRFPVSTALALGSQLYHRWGADVVGDLSRRDWLDTIELRSVEEWRARGWVPRPEAAELLVPSGQGREAHYFLRDDVLVADRLAALESEAEAEPDNVALFRPGPADAPALAEFAELIPWREVEMLRNLWRYRLVVSLPTSDPGAADPDVTHLRFSVDQVEGESVTVGLIRMIATSVLTHEMGTAPVCGWEAALVAEVAARRLGVEYHPASLLEEALTREEGIQFRWDVIYQTAATVESMLSGFPG